MFSDKIVVYGIGGSSKNFIMENVDKKDKIIALVGKNVEMGRNIEGIPIKEDVVLNDIDERFDLVIASQYYDSIYDRLNNEGKLTNPNLKDIYTMNFYMDFPTYSKDARVPEKEWDWLFDHFKDDYSKGLLNLIKKNRGNISSPRYLKVKDVLHFAGDEDYWKRVRGKNLHNKAVILDCGAYVGDKVFEIIEAVNRPIYSYYAFEPMLDSFQILSELKVNNAEHFYPIGKGVGLKEGIIRSSFDENKPDHSSVAFSISGANVVEIEVTNIDSMDFEEGYDYYIKMDIEGSELDALKGGENTIRTLHPNLAVCLYHKTEDLYQIPQWIDNLNIGYKMFLSGGNHSILIAVPE